jgi:Na+/H+ antiporter NhaC
MVSLLPVVLALVLAFRTKNAAFALLVGCLAGGAILGPNPVSGLVTTVQHALGNADFIWVMTIEVAVGVMVAFYLRAGVIAGFADRASTRIGSRRAAKGFGWGLGLFIFFSDYFSPLFAGPIARPLTDRHRVSREMLAYLLDSGSAPVAALVPISAWAVYVAGLLNGQGPIDSVDAGMRVFIQAIPYNIYGWLAVILAGLVAFELAPAIGPMRTAERRARDEGKVLRDGAVPLTGQEMEEIDVRAGARRSLVLYLLIPVAIVLSIALGTFAAIGSAKILEAFLVAVFYQGVAMSLGGHFAGVADAMDVAMRGLKGVLPAIVILALAYCINSVSKSLGAQDYVVELTRAWMTAGTIPVVVFVTAAATSFFTGTSWGTYALLTPFALPLALAASGGVIDTGVLATVGAVVSGGLFGDHCSPVSDTTCLSSFGAGSDHMDHVSTQLPYALIAGGAATVLYALVGWLSLSG